MRAGVRGDGDGLPDARQLLAEPVRRGRRVLQALHRRTAGPEGLMRAWNLVSRQQTSQYDTLFVGVTD